MANIDTQAIESASRLGLLDRSLTDDELSVLRGTIITSNKYLRLVSTAPDGITQAALSEGLQISVNTVQSLTRLLAKLGLIIADRQASAVGMAYIIYGRNWSNRERITRR